NDPAHGEVIPGSTGTPHGKDYDPALSLPCSYMAFALANFQVFYADDTLIPNTPCTTPTVSIAATDPSATKGASPADTGSFKITRVNGDWSSSLTIGFTISTAGV